MSCKSNNDKGKGCQDGDCVYPFIPNYVYCHDPDGKKNKTPVFTPIKHKKNGKMICATSITPKKVMKTYGYVSVKDVAKDVAKDVEKEGVDDKTKVKVKGVKVKKDAVVKKDDAKVDDMKVDAKVDTEFITFVAFYDTFNAFCVYLQLRSSHLHEDRELILDL